MVESGELDGHLEEPYPERKERGFKIFGAVALAVGLVLLTLIIYTMLFGYR